MQQRQSCAPAGYLLKCSSRLSLSRSIGTEGIASVEELSRQSLQAVALSVGLERTEDVEVAMLGEEIGKARRTKIVQTAKECSRR